MGASTATAGHFRRRSWVGASTAASVSLCGTLLDAHALVPRLHAGAGGDPFANAAKGVLGEVLGDALVRQGLLEGGGWSALTPAGGIHGIDGLYVKLDASGRVRGVMVAEAKTYGSKLNPSQGGQMGPDWLSHWLDESACAYQIGPLSAGSRPPSSALEVPMAGGSAKVWKEGGVWRTDGDPRAVEQACGRIHKTLSAASEQLISYRARIFRYTAVEDRHILTITNIDPSSGEKAAKQFVIDGAFDELSSFHQKLLREAFSEYFRALGASDAELQALVDRACADPGFAKNFQVKAKWWLLGHTLKNAARASFAGLFAAVVEVGVQWASGEGFDWTRVAQVTGLTFSATYAGLVAGAHLTTLVQGRAMQALLKGTALNVLRTGRVSTLLGASGGAVIGALLFAYGGALLGLHDWRTAHWSAASGLAGAGAGVAFASGVYGAAAAWGTAGTGTAIGTLSGAAQTSATLAWLGGSAKLGGLLLGVGVVAAGLAAGFAVQQARAALDRKEHQRLVEGHLLIAERIA